MAYFDIEGGELTRANGETIKIATGRLAVHRNQPGGEEWTASHYISTPPNLQHLSTGQDQLNVSLMVRPGGRATDGTVAPGKV